MNSTVQISQIKNLMNGIDILKMKDGLGVGITHYTSTSITLELNGSPPLQGQLVSLEGDIWINQEKLHFEAVAKVLSCTALAEGMYETELYLKQIQKNLWKLFLDSKTASQQHVDSLLKKVKGNE